MADTATMQRPTGPYRSAVHAYRDAGWRGVLPIPPRAKADPPVGYTGGNGGWPTDQILDGWAVTNGHGNIALRVPSGIVGIDVDQYGDKHGWETINTFRAEHDLEPLPDTWTSTSKPAPSGIRFFRVPDGVEFVTVIHPHVEIIQRRHRYAVVWPSIHKDTGLQYQWVSPDGEPSDRPPSPDEIAELPADWVNALRKADVDEITIDNGPVQPHRETTWAGPVADRLAEAVANMKVGSRHDTAVAAAAALARYEQRDFPGATAALDDLGDEFISAITREGEGQRTDEQARKEWGDILTSARNKVRSTAATAGPYVDPTAWITEADNDTEAQLAAASWPTIDPTAFYGLAGDVVATIEPHSESDPAALLADFLVSFGNCVGATPHAVADGSHHPARLNVVIVGRSAKARKGTSRANINALMEIADPIWNTSRVMGGLASGEGLIAAVADPDEEGNGGTRDKRLLVVEPEFARVLNVAARDGSTLSPIIRAAWDDGRLRVMTKRDPLVATGAHISVIGHITMEELSRSLTSTEAANGFGNRFLLVAARRSKLLPTGGALDPEELRVLGQRVGKVIADVRKVGLIRRTDAAEDRWADIYAELAEEDEDGLVGAMTARGDAQTLRLSVVYALLDGMNRIDVQHLEAAYALWKFSAATTRHIFGEASGNPMAEKILKALTDVYPKGLDGTQIRDLFSGHAEKEKLDQAKQFLIRKGWARVDKEPTSGRPKTVLVAAGVATKGPLK